MNPTNEITNIQCEGWFGPCESMNASRVHMYTNYVDEERNYRIMCPDCAEEADEYWNKMWLDYYWGRL